jgi:hypothetical protein
MGIHDGYLGSIFEGKEGRESEGGRRCRRKKGQK